MSNRPTDAETAAADTSGERITCPQCGSADVLLQQKKGSALCRSMYLCDDCGEPFEDFS